jgi:hypothetical protein
VSPAAGFGEFEQEFRIASVTHDFCGGGYCHSRFHAASSDGVNPMSSLGWE